MQAGNTASRNKNIFSEEGFKIRALALLPGISQNNAVQVKEHW